jgi:exonuclease VII large subunit
MPKSRQRKNHKQKSQARTKRVKAEQAKFQKEYQAKMMEQINKLKEEYEKAKEQEVLDRTSEVVEAEQVNDEVGSFEGTTETDNITIDYKPNGNSPF